MTANAWASEGLGPTEACERIKYTTERNAPSCKSCYADFNQDKYVDLDHSSRLRSTPTFPSCRLSEDEMNAAGFDVEFQMLSSDENLEFHLKSLYIDPTLAVSLEHILAQLASFFYQRN